MTILIISVPFLASIILISLGRYIGIKGSRIISIISIMISEIISINELINELIGINIKKLDLFEWLMVGVTTVKIDFIYNKESIIMINIISIITLIVIIYSYWYMEGEEGINRFISNLLLFAVTMYILVLSNNLLLLFIGWEGVGIMSYILINYWYTNLNSNKSGLKAIIYNKIGDITLLLSIVIIINLNNNVNINNNIYLELTYNYINIIAILFIISAIAKSAQFFLHNWLGDAMAGPTPVSALLHAATMVTAGVYLLVKISNYINISHTYIKYFIIFIGLLTIIFGGLTSSRNWDIKKIIAFSTCSQIGYMFINNGFFSNNNLSSLFHLITHGFFKALLFLSAGIIIHNSLNNQDLRKFGSLIFKLPITYTYILIGTLSIIAFPFLSGYYSKENIIENSLIYNNNLFIYIFLVLGALLTIIYSFKLFSSFFSFNNGPQNLLEILVYREIPNILNYPLFILLIGSIFIGYFFKDYFLGLGIHNLSIDIELYPIYIKLIPTILPIFIYLFYKSQRNSNYLYWLNNYYLFLHNSFNRKLFLDPLFNYFFASPILFLSYNVTYKLIDRGILEYIGPVNFYRIIFNFNKYKLNNQSIYNLNNLFIYLFLSFFLFFSFIILFLL